MADVPTKKKRSPLKGRGGWVMLGVLAVLLGLFYWDQQAPPPRDPDSQPPIAEFAALRARDVARVELKRGSSDSKGASGFTLVKQNGRWSFEAPGRYRANSESVDQWLEGLLDNAVVNRALQARPEDVSGYGLDRPGVEVVFTDRNGRTRTLQTGKAFGSDGNVVYARIREDGRLFMLNSFQVDELKNKKAEDLRDKRLVELPSEKQVTRLVIERPEGAVEVRRQGEEQWSLVRPFAAPAEKFDVESLVSQLKTAEAEKIVADSAADLAKYGLDRPQTTLRVTDRAGERAILFGKADGSGNVYAVRGGEREVLLVSRSTFEALNKAPGDLRDRRLVTLSRDRIRFIELTNGRGTSRLQKVAGDEWQITDAADPKPKKAKADVVQRVIDTVTSSAFRHVEEAPKDLARYGLDKPAITVRVNEGSGASQLFLLGKKMPGGNYYAKGSGPAVFEVQPFVHTDLDIGPKAFQ